MKKLRVYESFLTAQFAAEYLRAHGVPALAIAPLVMNEILVFKKHVMLSDVFVAPGVDEQEAGRLLDEFDSSPPDLEEGWEELGAAPDLTRLDLSKLPADVVPECPKCGTDLRGLGDEGECSGCGRSFDLVDLIVHAYGPEVLADCYEQAERPDLAHAELVPVSCPKCGVSLIGQPQAGPCPHCDDWFDKRDLLDRLRGR